MSSKVQQKSLKNNDSTTTVVQNLTKSKYQNLPKLINCEETYIKPFLQFFEKFTFLETHEKLAHLLNTYVYHKGVKIQDPLFFKISKLAEHILKAHYLIENFTIDATEKLKNEFIEIVDLNDSEPLTTCLYIDKMIVALSEEEDSTFSYFMNVVSELKTALIRAFLLKNNIDVSLHLTDDIK